ncbi:MBL fold metallo-hydrolase [Salidesulfovibrio onnuriiensis]|uniref:MBL fold metallo-hydrolase n=1 Tax=Salidesulfovibrio onnuriiensis TaxID=2583823 RepID=UPI00202AFFE5|nr:MBL fold metallo-hydrolase [Salidesulfovibrio onnuriiensis]
MMRFRFWGTRGSMPAPGPDTLRYGGNTTCLEVRCGEHLVILDGGSGIRPLGLELARNMPVDCDIFISHTHWDHIHGLPFFVPLFVPGNTIRIYGPPNPVAMAGVEEVLDKQLAYPHFPVRRDELKADIHYETLQDRQVIDLGFATASTLLMNHPAMNFGVKLEFGDRKFFFTGDHEPFYNIYEPGDDDYEEYGNIVRERQQGIVDFLRGVDVMVADSQYTDREYESKRGWGHSTFRHNIELALEAGIGKLYLTHHETTRTDSELDDIGEWLRHEWGDCGVELFLAREGHWFDV